MASDTGIGNRIQQFRKTLSLSQTALARRVGRSRGWLASVESGKQRRVFVDDALRIAKIFGISLDALVGDEPADDGDEKESR